MALRLPNPNPFDDEDLMERGLAVKDNDMVFAIVLCVLVLGGICICIKVNSWIAAAKANDRELNERRADHVGWQNDDEEEAAPTPLKKSKTNNTKKKKRKKEKTVPEESAESTVEST